MKVKLHELTLTNGLPLEAGVLEPPLFETTVLAVLGPDDSAGEELFDFSVTLNRSMCEDVGSRGYVWSGQTLVVSCFDPAQIKNAVAEILAGVEGLDWTSVVEQLRKHMRWEFDSYRIKS